MAEIAAALQTSPPGYNVIMTLSFRALRCPPTKM